MDDMQKKDDEREWKSKKESRSISQVCDRSMRKEIWATHKVKNRKNNIRFITDLALVDVTVEYITEEERKKIGNESRNLWKVRQDFETASAIHKVAKRWDKTLGPLLIWSWRACWQRDWKRKERREKKSHHIIQVREILIRKEVFCNS